MKLIDFHLNAAVLSAPYAPAVVEQVFDAPYVPAIVEPTVPQAPELPTLPEIIQCNLHKLLRSIEKIGEKHFKSFLFFTAAPVAVEVQAAIPEPVEEVFVAPAPVVERK